MPQTKGNGKMSNVTWKEVKAAMDTHRGRKPRFTPDTVETIRRDFVEGTTVANLATKYDVNAVTIRSVLRGDGPYKYKP